MGFIDHPGTLTPATPSLPGEDLLIEPEPVARRVNWLYSGVLLGAAGWLLVLAVIFAVIGDLTVASALLGGFGLCLLAVWRAGRRLRTVA